MIKVPQYYRKEFDTFFSKIYDLTFMIVTFFHAGRLRREAAGMLAIKKGSSVLDIACGTGGLTLILAEMAGTDGKVVGADLSQKMLDIAAKKSRQYSQITYERRNFEHLNYKNNFDFVAVAFGAHEVPVRPRKNLYRQAYKALKRGGKLLVFDFAGKESTNIMLNLFFWLFLAVAENPNGINYIHEDHKKEIEGTGLRRVKHKIIGGIFAADVYKKLY